MTHKKRTPFFIFTLLLLILAACGAQSESATADMDSGGFAAEAPMEEAAFEEMAAYDSGDFGFSDDSVLVEVTRVVTETIINDETVESSQNTATSQAQTQERLIIRNGNLNLVVVDTEAALDAITEMVESNGGWVVNSSVFQYDENAKTGSITVRVPATGFNSAMEAMKGLAVEVQSESTSGQDVTEEYVDLNLQLENLEATADRVRAFLDEARNVEEALAVNVELSELEGRIERIKGRVEFLSQSAAYSTISVELIPDVLSQPIEVAGWRPEGVAREAIEALIDALQGIASFLIWGAIYLLPILLLLGIPVWLLYRFVIRRWWQRRQANRALPTES